MTNTGFIISTFYKFLHLSDLTELKLQLLKLCGNLGIKGTILIAEEGVNATISGSRKAIDSFYSSILDMQQFADLEFKETCADFRPFGKLKVKIKDEIITFKTPIDIANRGEYLEPQEWDNYLEAGQALVIDTRNDYEIDCGTFKKAINPQIKRFTQLPEWVMHNLSEVDKEKPILMFCTGGVRCEKSTAFVKALGFERVYHLRGGIINYLNKTKNARGNWSGECFVFDDRRCISENLEPAENLEVV